MQALFGGEPDRQEPGSDVVARRGRLPVGGAQTRRTVRQVRFGRHDFQTARLGVVNNGFGFRLGR